jgi:dihydrofolate reductase
VDFKFMLSAIAVIGKNRELGRKNDLLWQVPGDLPRFRQLTMGHPIIMGRKTYESIGRELPGRTNIVMSHSGAINSIEKAMELAKRSAGKEEIFVIGGGEIFTLAMPLIEKLYLTVVEATAPADTYFPEYDQFNKVITDEAKEERGMKFRYLTLERV